MNPRARSLLFTTFIVSSALLFASCETESQKNSPSGVLKRFIAAKKNKDVAAMKNALSRSTLAMIENGARAQNSTLDEVLVKDEGVPADPSPEMRNEKIEGDTASVEVKNSITGDWQAFPFVKEDGHWKFALDEFMKKLMQQISEKAKTPVGSVSANSANNNAR